MSSSTQICEHRNFDLSTEEGFSYLETKNYVSYFVYFSGLITIHSDFRAIILIKKIFKMKEDQKSIPWISRKLSEYFKN